MKIVGAQAEDELTVRHAPEAVFDLLCEPRRRPGLIPMEQRIVRGETIRQVGDAYIATLEFAARKLTYTSRCTSLVRPEYLAMEMEGDIGGSQEWRLRPEPDGIRVLLALDLFAPSWLPAYLQEETAAKNWAKTLIGQILRNVSLELDADAEKPTGRHRKRA